MASALIGALRVALSLNTAEFESGATKAATIAKAKGKEIEGAFSGAKAAITGLFAAFSVGLLAEQIKKSLDYAGSLAEVSRTLGVTTKDLQTFRYAASQTGVSQDELEVGLRRLTVSMGKAELGSKAQAKAFGAIGISLDELKGKNTGDVFRLMADGLSKVTDRSQRAAIEMTLMGRSGSTLDNLLAPGAARLNELAEAAQRLGIVLSDSQIQGAEETAHKLAAVKEVLAAQIAGVVADNARSILSLSTALASLTGSIARFLGSNPQLALSIIGGLAGRALLGPVGLAAGALAGAALGSKAAQSNADGNNNVAFRAQQLLGARQRYYDAVNGTAQVTSVSGRPIEGSGLRIDPSAAKSEYERQAALYVAAKAAASAPKVTPTGNVPQFLGGGAKKAKNGPADKTEQDNFEFAQQQREMDLQILDAKKQLSHDYVEQTTLSVQQLDIEKQIKDAEIDHKVEQAKRDAAAGKITQSTLAQIEIEAGIEKQKEASLDKLKRQAVLEAEQEQRYRDVAALDQQQLDFRKGHLQDELALAKTAQERRDIELKILDIDYQIQKAKLEEVLNDQQATDQAKEIARRSLVDLNGEQGLKRQDVLNQTQGPLQQYLDSLPTTSAKWTEALQSVAVDGFGAITNAADTLAGKIVKVGGIFGDVTRTILADLLKIELQKMIIAPLVKALGGLIGGSTGGDGGLDLSGNIFDFVTTPPPGFALGGSMRLGGKMGTDQNQLALNGTPIARVSYGEQLSIGNGGGGGGNVTVHQTFQFEGVAVTQDQFVRGLVATRASTITAIKEAQRRK